MPPDRPAVLVVDDNHANLIAMEALLSTLDLEVARAPSGKEALRQLLERDFAVVLMDVQMPGLDGFQTTQLIRQRDRTRYTPIIFVTAIFTDKGSAHKAYDLGAIDFVTKPFDEAILKAKVAALVGYHQQRAVIEQQAEALREKQRETDREHAARQAAEESNRAKDQFLAMLSHELRAPLNTILGWASRLEREADVPPKLVKALDAIGRSARAQSRLIDDLLDVSQIVAQKLTIERELVDLRTVVDGALAALQASADDKGVRIVRLVDDDRFPTLGDARRLEQVAAHILSNAIKFSEPGGEVRVELACVGTQLRLRVTDGGIGMGSEFLPHVFDRFRQHDGGRTRRHGGLGIGLTVARELVELHGGTIRAHSEGLGRGTELVVLLPAAASGGEQRSDDEPAPAAHVAVAATTLAPLRILVVDDDADARDLLATLLGEVGALVTVAGSAGEAFQTFRDGAFDMMVSDLGMPDEDGNSLLRRIRALEAERGDDRVVALALSGYGSAVDVAQSRAAGFAAHVVKPFEAVNLIALLARLRPAHTS
ncbi:MAG TPA: response regulator [Polyangia bacterium]